MQALPKEEAAYHLKRCIDSGMWVPGGGAEAGDEATAEGDVETAAAAAEGDVETAAAAAEGGEEKEENYVDVD